ncbi:hypothetical protein [Staphylococcus epidermidis]|uniref:hypothetical protein n=1 Tax=Staphylococcus epidermidis TaxID=1282 RepID=UPI0016428B48|nr:hypothetical protein [Staphylococcus epidermidis]
MGIEYKMGFRLDGEFRSMVMVWYCGGLSAIMSYLEGENGGENGDMTLGGIEEMGLGIE